MKRQPRYPKSRLRAVNNQERTRRRPFRLTTVLVLAFMCFASVSVVQSGLKLAELKEQREKLRYEYTLLKEKNSKLQNIIDILKSDEYIERRAREELGMVGKDEIPYLMVPGKDRR